MSQLIWLPEALLDLAKHFEFLKLKNPAAAGRAAQAIRDAGFSLVQNPERGNLLSDGSDRRKLIVPLGKHGYVIHYYEDYLASVIQTAFAVVNLGQTLRLFAKLFLASRKL